MRKSLEQSYKKEYEVLKGLFKAGYVEDRIERLNFIHEYTESIWDKYVKLIPNNTIRYLLIAESPPWSDKNSPQYFLDPTSRSRLLMNAFKGAFDCNQPNFTPENIISCFAEKGLLLIDSIPFSMCYKSVRRRPRYEELVNLSVKSYMLKKLLESKFRFNKDMNIVFWYRVNAIYVMKSLNGVLDLNGNKFILNANMICANNKSNYPDAGKIKDILKL
jgi:hypothetical protein